MQNKIMQPHMLMFILMVMAQSQKSSYHGALTYSSILHIYGPNFGRPVDYL
jgi:hypothetical protein